MSRGEARAETGAGRSHVGEIAGLLLTIFLCLPSLVGGSALLLEMALHRDISQWQETASALIALGALVGGPLVTVAAVVGGTMAFSRGLSLWMKYAHLMVVATAAVSTLSLLLRFGK